MICQNNKRIIPRSKGFLVKHPSSLELMPKPFEWIEIPAGQVKMDGNVGSHSGYLTRNMKFDIEAFSIAKYVLTNSQFAKFIDAGGYNQSKWWTTEGWQERLHENWIEPRFWNEVEWNKPDYPVVGVSWYESIAFCQWISTVSSENISLPTEQQWQWAARSDTGWAFPYGDQFDESRCNFNTQTTTPVTYYEGSNKGDSPFGVVDMSGNVSEWCLTQYEAHNNQLGGQAVRVLRGGSWATNSNQYMRVDYRDGYHPSYGDDLWGFRIVRI